MSVDEAAKRVGHLRSPPTLPSISAPLTQEGFGDASATWVLEGQAQVGIGATFTGRGRLYTRDAESEVFIGSNANIHECFFNVRGRRARVFIGDNCRMRGVQFHVNGDDCLVIIGRDTTWESGAALCSDKGSMVAIGDDCMLSNGVLLRTHDGHAIFSLETGAEINGATDVVVEEHVWLGNSVRVSPGSVVGAGSIVGQLSLVTGTVHPRSLYVGTPARKIRSNVGWDRGRKFHGIPIHLRSPLPNDGDGVSA